MSDPEEVTDWNTGDKSGPVKLGTHSIWLTATGPNRKAGEPIIIIIQGLGSSITSWAAVCRELSSFIRVYSYDRAGYGRSELSQKPPTSTNLAIELENILHCANVHPPYIIIAHSWGGILSREFLALRNPHDFAGMLFIEANQERTLKVLDWRKLFASPVLRDVNVLEASGILDSHKLTPEEWQTYQAAEATEKHKKQAGLEFEQYAESFTVLGEKSQLSQRPPLLGNVPVCVLRGDNRANFQRLYEAGINLDNRTDAERMEFERVLQKWDETDRALQQEITCLSSKTRYDELRGTGHDLQLTAPVEIAERIRWILAETKGSE